MQKDQQAKVDFGFREVAKETKQKLVDEVFSKVAGGYDLMNDALSFGLHRLWKSQFIDYINPQAGEAFLDLASGSGDIILGIAKRIPAQSRHKSRFVASDINLEMLEVAKHKALYEGVYPCLEFQKINAENIAFADNSFESISMAFGLRNTTDRLKVLKEVLRCLKPSGAFWVLEFSHPEAGLLQKGHNFYLENCVPLMGDLLRGDRASYQYLGESIQKFPKQQELQALFEQAGFASCGYVNLSGGIVAIHFGFKDL